MWLSREELPRFIRFCTVGVANTGLHVVVVALLVEVFGMSPTPGNMLAFLCANTFSFVINSRWTFRESKATVRQYPRFLAVSLTGLLISGACVEIAQHLGLHYLIGVAASVVAVALSGYVLNRMFVFR